MKPDIKQHENGYVARLIDNCGNAITEYCYFCTFEEAEQYLSERYLDYYSDGI